MQLLHDAQVLIQVQQLFCLSSVSSQASYYFLGLRLVFLVDQTDYYLQKYCIKKIFARVVWKKPTVNNYWKNSHRSQKEYSVYKPQLKYSNTA